MLQYGDEGDDNGKLNHPMGIAVYKDKVYVADSVLLYSTLMVNFAATSLVGVYVSFKMLLSVRPSDQLLVIISTV